MDKTVAGWALAALMTVIAGWGWLRHPNLPPQPPALTASADNSTDLALLKARISSLESENRMLYSELTNRPAPVAAPRMAALQPKPAASATPDAEMEAKAQQLTNLLSRATNGDKASGQQAALTMFQLMKSGKAGFDEAKAAFENSNDPKIKASLLPMLLMQAGKDRPEFVASELPGQTDPVVRDTLMKQAPPGLARDPKVAAAYMTALQDQSDPQARALAAQGLQYANDPNAQQVLLNVASSDSDENVRLRAIAALAARPNLRDQLQAMIQNDPSARVKQAGACELLLSGQN